jgi:hypothetical protein
MVMSCLLLFAGTDTRDDLSAVIYLFSSIQDSQCQCGQAVLLTHTLVGLELIHLSHVLLSLSHIRELLAPVRSNFPYPPPGLEPVGSS